MDIEPDDFRRHFEILSDEALLATKRDDLVPAAQVIYDAERMRRGLHAGVQEPESAVHQVEEEEQVPAEEGLVAVGTFTDLDEARLARGLLQSAEIPSGLVNDTATPGVLHLMVPQSHEAVAQQILGGEISDEELAAQAEAAGPVEEEIPEEEAETGA